MLLEKPKLYVGCGLTHAPQTFKDQVEEMKAQLGQEWNVLQFLGTTAGTSTDVYRVDILENVATCDAFVAVMDEPSWGLGWESREAVLLNKPSLLVAASKITRLAFGAVEHFSKIMKYREYEDLVRDVPEIIREEFAGILQPNLQPMRGFDTAADINAGE